MQKGERYKEIFTIVGQFALFLVNLKKTGNVCQIWSAHKFQHKHVNSLNNTQGISKLDIGSVHMFYFQRTLSCFLRSTARYGLSFQSFP